MKKNDVKWKIGFKSGINCDECDYYSNYYLKRFLVIFCFVFFGKNYFYCCI